MVWEGSVAVKAEFEVLDERFKSCGGDQWVEQLHTGSRWTEGPAYFPAGRYLVWSDIPNDRILRWDETDGQVSQFRSPAGYTNGHTVDRQGRLVSCEHLARRVTRTEFDGTVTVLADRYEGKRQDREQDGCHVYRVDPGTAEVTRVADDFARPNGLAFSPDESRLSISDTGATHDPDGPRHIRAFDVVDDRTLSGGEVFAV